MLRATENLEIKSKRAKINKISGELESNKIEEMS